MTLWQACRYIASVWWSGSQASECEVTYLAMDPDLYDWLRADSVEAS